MRIMRMSSVVAAEPVARDSSFLMRASRLPKTPLSCFSSSSTKPMVAAAARRERELRGDAVAIGGNGGGSEDGEAAAQVVVRGKAERDTGRRKREGKVETGETGNLGA